MRACVLTPYVPKLRAILATSFLVLLIALITEKSEGYREDQTIRRPGIYTRETSRISAGRVSVQVMMLIIVDPIAALACEESTEKNGDLDPPATVRRFPC